MALGATLPIESIASLADAIKQEASNLTATLGALRARCQRDPAFTGNAADAYDQYMVNWDSHQQGLLQALEGAAQILSSFAAHLDENQMSVAQAFNTR